MSLERQLKAFRERVIGCLSEDESDIISGYQFGDIVCLSLPANKRVEDDLGDVRPT